MTTLLEARVADAGTSVPGLGLAVYDSQDRKVYEHMVGDFAPDRRVAVASASKMIAGTVLFEVIRQGHLSLDSTTGQMLGWSGDKANITLRHLLSFTSGLQNEHLCTVQAGITLADCVATIASTNPVAPPGTRFDYGSTHLHVAARMAEVTTGKSWNTLFRETLATPLGLPEDVTYFTRPRQAQGITNPLIAGGLRTSMNEYAPLFALVFHKGRQAGREVGTPELFDAQAREPFPGVVIGNSPVKDLSLPFRYGLTAWLQCATPAEGCDVISSPGAFGWTPWMDREAGYYAILGMQLDRQDEGVVGFSVNLSGELQPLIRAALGR
ncbi:beta-lactamase family protein [Pyxidicoccus fallax]|uniref:Beta-lactamase family protein n=1 Tax=Pyxidicoccus fallax TaxID=394095 RepID=A0A848L9E2_9BACT|nr:beta-lactamase family protein [Pyxidicoccus fallax]NPC86920.1 beta-lactamase family protein [Pyxidicoccus fallax]